ncbi:glycogen synthase kinase binding protein [Menidia menidia]
MPCRKEDFLPQEVDALVAQIGEALQLHGGGPQTVSVSVSCRGGTGGPGGAAGGPGPAQRGCCLRLRGAAGRAPGGRARAGPYRLPGDRDWDQIRPWNRKRVGAAEDDPHRLLQELLLSGNLIKEAVRRLQLSGDPVPCS